MYFLHLSVSSVILIDTSTDSPVHVLMLSTQAVRGLPRLRASGIAVERTHLLQLLILNEYAARLKHT